MNPFSETMDLGATDFGVLHLDSTSLESMDFDPMNFGFVEQLHTSSIDTGTQRNGVSAQQLSIKSRGRRSRVLPEREWARVRPIITKLYIDEERSLKEIQAIMTTEHDFTATENMYKTRFSKWGVWKNYRKEQYDHYDNQTTGSLYNGHGQLPISINSKPVKQHKILRHRRQQRRPQRELQTSHSSESQNSVLPARFSILGSNSRRGTSVECQPSMRAASHLQYTDIIQGRSTPSSSDPTLSFITGRDHVEKFYYLARDYCSREYCHRSNTCELIFHVLILDLRSVMNDNLLALFLSAANMPQRKCKDGWLQLHRACSQVEIMIKEQSFRLVERLMYLFESRRWAGYDEVRIALLGFIASMARKCLARGDPRAEMMSMLSHGRTIDAVMPNFPSLIFEVVVNRHYSLRERAMRLRQLLLYPNRRQFLRPWELEKIGEIDFLLRDLWY